MFTGLIETTGTVVSVTPPKDSAGPTRIRVAAGELAERLKTGDSVAVSGVCLTALEIGEGAFSADLARETVERTTLASLTAGKKVNLELPTPVGAPLGGHVVQGHVDGIATLLSLDALDAARPETSDWRLRLRLPSALARYVVPQGSITVEGISLTVAGVSGDVVEIAIIPHTYQATALHTLAVRAAINIEVDVLGKYAEQRASAKSGWTLTEAYLLANGY